MGWQWTSIKQNNLISKLSKSIEKEIKQFDEKLNNFSDLSLQIYDKLTEIIYLSIIQIFPEFKKISITKESFSPQCKFEWQVGGSGVSPTVSFYQLIFENKTLDEYIENFKKVVKKHKEDTKNPHKFSKETIGGKFMIRGLTKEKEDFEQIMIIIKERIQKDSEIQDYIVQWRTIHQETLNLKEKLENFEKKIKN